MRALLLLVLVACGGSRHGDFCDGACVCEQQPECVGDCGDGCELGCRDTTACDVVCDAGCTLICERVSSCDVDCGPDCDVTCRDLSSCDVVMATGSVRCERVGACNVTCRSGAPAIEESPGVWICP